MQAMIERSHSHKGTSFLEIYQNCNIFNDGAFAPMTDKVTKSDTVLWLEDGQPMVFGAEQNKGIKLDGNKPSVVELNGKFSMDDVLVHNEKDFVIASMLANLTYQDDFPDPIGVLYAINAPTYDDMATEQVNSAIENRGTGSIQDLLNSGQTWEVK